VLGDPMEQLLRRLHHDALLAREVPRSQYLQRVIAERRRHVRTVRSAARARNQPRRTLALVLLAVLGLLVAMCARAAASPARPYAPLDSDPALESELDPALDPDSDPELESVSVAQAEPESEPGSESVPARVPVTPPPITTPLPPISLVLAAAYRSASLDQSPVASWRWRTRLAGFVPTVTIRDGRDATWRDISDPTIGYVSVFTVSATWRLDRLLFDANELRISAIDAARRRERRHLAEAVIRLYFAVARGSARADEAAAELDALTDGWFSQAVARAVKQ